MNRQENIEEVLKKYEKKYKKSDRYSTLIGLSNQNLR